MHQLSTKELERKKVISLRRHTMRRDLRTLLEKKGFVEIPTPHIRLAKEEVSLVWNKTNCTVRDCMELKLRSALVYGLDAVFEIGSCFREGENDETHHPEFQMIETFSRNMSFEGLIALSQEMLNTAFSRLISGFRRIDVSQTLQKHDPELDLTSPDTALLDYLKAKYPDDKKIQDAKYAYEAMNRHIENVVESDHATFGSVEEPVMLWRYPRCTVCLAKPIENETHLIQRAEFFIQGKEVGHGFVDDIDAKSVEERMSGNHHDAKFLQLMHNKLLPESAGVGFGLDRLLMIDSNINHIRECVHESCW